METTYTNLINEMQFLISLATTYDALCEISTELFGDNETILGQNNNTLLSQTTTQRVICDWLCVEKYVYKNKNTTQLLWLV